MVISVYVDIDLAGDKLKLRSGSGFIIFLNQAPIYFYSKKIGEIKSITFGLEFMTLKTCCEYMRFLRYRLRMLEIPISQPVFIYGDNEDVVKNASIT